MSGQRELIEVGEPITDLNTLLGSSITLDAAALEFDITPSSDTTIVFEYLFASEEYPEWVDQTFNDTVGIFVWVGDKETGTPLGNIAVVDPGTVDVPVTVNNVHGGWDSDPDVPAVNSDYYVDNADPENDSLPAHDTDDPVYNIQYDGATDPLTTEELEMDEKVTYHIKIVIADATDRVWDSAVFIGCAETVE